MMNGCPKTVNLEYASPIKKAKQMKLNTRAVRRQAKREKNRKWKIEYVESEEET